MAGLLPDGEFPATELNHEQAGEKPYREHLSPPFRRP